MRTPLSYALLAVAIGGCRQYDGTTTASGQVVDRHTGQPVPNAFVQLTGIGTSGTSQGNTFPTDALGRFSLAFDAQPDRNYTLLAYSAAGYASGYGDAPLLKTGRHNDNLRVKAGAPAWVKFACVDDPPASKIGLYTSGYDGSGDNQTIGPGSFSFVRPIGSNSPGTIYCELTDEKGHATIYRQAVNVASFDTATVTIHF